MTRILVVYTLVGGGQTSYHSLILLCLGLGKGGNVTLGPPSTMKAIWRAKMAAVVMVVESSTCHVLLLKHFHVLILLELRDPITVTICLPGRLLSSISMV